MAIHELPYGIKQEIADERGYRRITSVEELVYALNEDGFIVSRDGDAVCCQFSTQGVKVRYGPESHLQHMPWSLYPTHWPVRGQDMVVGHEVRFEEPVEIPVLDGDGQPTGEVKRLRYRGPQNAPVAMDCPTRFQPLLGNPNIPLIITEGIKKIDTLASYYATSGPIDICGIALRGVAMWSKRDDNGARILLPQWDDVALEERNVYIIFDSDVAEKQSVIHEMRALGDALRQRGGKVFWAPLPAAPGQKIGLDDFLYTGSLDELHLLPLPPLQRQRTRVNIGGGDLRRVADEAWAAYAGVVPADTGKLLVRGSELVYFSEHENGFVSYQPQAFRGQISTAVDFGKWTAAGTWSPTFPPDPVVSEILSRDGGDYLGAEIVEEARSVPFLGADGKFVHEKGIHSGVYFHPHPLLDGKVQHKVPTHVSEIEEALGTLEGLLGDFSFEDQASKANAYAMLLTPFLRQYIDGPCPMFNVTGPDKGQGKTLLCWTALAPSCGEIVQEKKVSDTDDEELRKFITAQMLKGTPAIILGNMNGGIQSMLLASALTAEKWSDRVLGESKVFTAPINHLWVINGRNVRLSDELQDRTVTIVLDAKGANLRRMGEEHWRHKREDLHKWALEDPNFAHIVSAVGTLIQHWLAGTFHVSKHANTYGNILRDSASRYGPEMQMGSFAAWSKVVGGVLAAAGIEGFLGNLDQHTEVDDERVEASEFLAAWHALALPPIKAVDLHATHCVYGSALYNSLPSVVRNGPSDRLEARLKSFLRTWNGTYLGGYMLKGTGTKNRSLSWIVEADDQTDRMSVDNG